MPCFALLTALSAVAQTSGTVAVPEQVSVLVRPVLDELQRYRSDDGKTPQRLLEYFYALTKKQGRFSDEALVVLMCFDVMGESQEDADAVIARGRKMLPFLILDYSRATQTNRERHAEAVFMRLRTLYAASHLFLSDTFRHSPTRAGMRGLRHNSRHRNQKGQNCA